MSLSQFENEEVIFDFNPSSSLRSWYSVDDGVMGGISSGSLKISDQGHGLFEGNISLDYNGGFSSVRYRFDEIRVDPESKVIIKLKGDGKKYQFRVKHNFRAYYSYIFQFETSGEWEEIVIPLEEMYPSFRGRKLDLPDFDHQQIEEITLLIGNKKEEDFQLLIDKIEVVSK